MNPNSDGGVVTYERGSTKFLVEVKFTSNLRDVRHALLGLTYRLESESSAVHAFCVIAGATKLTANRLNEEVEQFRRIVTPSLASRVHLLSLGPDGSSTGPELDSEFEEWLRDFIDGGRRTPSMPRQQTVISALVLLWLRGRSYQSAKALQELCATTYPTVAAALTKLRHDDLIETARNRSFMLRQISSEELLKLIEAHRRSRKTFRFIDPTGMARRPAFLGKRLFEMQKRQLAPHVAVGGVLGGLYHYPDLDTTAASRLDLSVYGTSDLSFVTTIDAGLIQSDSNKSQAAIVVHIAPEPEAFVTRAVADGLTQSWASELECLSDLLDAGLSGPVQEWIFNLSQRRLDLSKPRD